MDRSIDDSGKIADEFLKDNRVKVFHKDNGRLSSARNIGLDQVTGEYIAFVDADDWIETKTYETVMSYMADICTFGRSTDRPGQNKEWSPSKEYEMVSGSEAIKKLVVDGSIGFVIWDKVYRKELFHDIRFLEGYNYEDARVTYMLLEKAEKTTLIPKAFYHYVQYEDSIVHTQTLKNRLVCWSASFDVFYTSLVTVKNIRNLALEGA